MAFTSADLDAVDRAIASGELEVRFADGRGVKYRDTASLLNARSFIAQQLSGAPTVSPTEQVGAVTYAEYDRG